MMVTENLCALNVLENCNVIPRIAIRDLAKSIIATGRKYFSNQSNIFLVRKAIAELFKLNFKTSR